MITGDQIRAARKRAGYSQEKLADLVGVSLRTVGAWERGTNAPGMAEQRLIEVLRDHLGDTTGVSPLRAVSDAELVAEIARRFARTAQAQEEGERDVERDAPSMKIAARRPGDLTDEELRALKAARGVAERQGEDSGTLDAEGTA